MNKINQKLFVNMMGEFEKKVDSGEWDGEKAFRFVVSTWKHIEKEEKRAMDFTRDRIEGRCPLCGVVGEPSEDCQAVDGCGYWKHLNKEMEGVEIHPLADVCPSAVDTHLI